MKHFRPVKRPRGWQKYVLKPGIAWLQQHPNAKRPTDLWSPYRPYLARGFGELCAYTVLFVPEGTVDHFIPWEEARRTNKIHLAYDWSNLRYAAPWFNSARKNTPVPDPYTVNDDWFRLILPTLELVATEQVPEEMKNLVENALRWLGKDDRVLRQRRMWFQKYREGKITLECLYDFAPMIACALVANPRYLLPADRPAARPKVRRKTAPPNV